MATLADLPLITQDQIARLKLRGKTAELEALKAKLPEALRGLVDEVEPVASSMAPRRPNSRNAPTVPADKPQAAPAPTAEPEPANNPAPAADTSALQQSLDEIKAQLIVLQQATSLKIGPSITYDDINDKRVRNQLLSDNIRMENARFDVSTYERYGQELAFRRFCVFAFFQVEELINLWLYNEYRKEPDRMNDSMGSKIWFFTQKKPGHLILHSLRSVRNIEEHRCTVMLSKNDGDVSALRVNYEQIKERLEAEKKKARELRAKTYAADKDAADKYFVAVFLKEPGTNSEKVREELRQLYKIVSATQKSKA